MSGHPSIAIIDVPAFGSRWLALILFWLPFTLHSQNIESGERYQITLRSDSLYDHPVRDVDIRCFFTSPDGDVDTVRGFWDGERTFRVRYAPFSVGCWTFRTICGDTANRGLHGVVGSVDVVPYTGLNPYRRHGRLRVSDSRRHLCYADGTPFFYLADTAWEIVWKSSLTEARAYAADRQAKKFTTIQLVVGSHFYLTDSGVANRHDEPLYMRNDYSYPNPRYFDYLDSLVSLFEAHNLVTTIVPLWGMMASPYADNGYHARYVTSAEARIWYRYVGARYGADEVVWFIAGDVAYDTDERRAYWQHAANSLLSAAVSSQIVSIHPHGWGSSYSYFPDETWLDFHTYQSSHSINGLFTVIGASEGWNHAPIRPILNGEPLFEDIYDDLWQQEDTTRHRPDRAKSVDVRRAAWTSILSGALVGVAYGANGVFQWSEPWGMEFQFPRFTVMEAIHLPGSREAGVMRSLLERWSWHELHPCSASVVRHVTGGNGTLPTLCGNDRTLLYFPAGTTLAIVTSPLTGNVETIWTRAWSGEEWGSVTSYIPDTHTNTLLAPPDPALDWFVVMRPMMLSSTGRGLDLRGAADARYIEGGWITVDFRYPEACQVTFESWSLAGSRVGSAHVRVDEGVRSVNLRGERGCFVRVIVDDGRRRQSMVIRAW